MRIADRFRALLQVLPEDGSITLTAASLRDWLASEETGQETRPTAELTDDLTINHIASSMKRSLSTVRGWLNQGLIPGAYKLRGRDWRVPPAAYEAFRKAQAEKDEPRRAAPRRRADLGAWRKVANQ